MQIINNSKGDLIEILFKVDYITSVNSIYDVNWRAKKFFKSPNYQKLIAQIHEQLQGINFEENIRWLLDEGQYANLTTQVVFKEHFNKRDLDNTLKGIQDSVFSFLGVNDAKVIESHNFKSYREGTSEFVIIRISRAEHDPHFFNS